MSHRFNYPLPPPPNHAPPPPNSPNFSQGADTLPATRQKQPPAVQKLHRALSGAMSAPPSQPAPPPPPEQNPALNVTYSQLRNKMFKAPVGNTVQDSATSRASLRRQSYENTTLESMKAPQRMTNNASNSSAESSSVTSQPSQPDPDGDGDGDGVDVDEEGYCIHYSQNKFTLAELVNRSVPLPMKATVVTSLYGVCGEESLLDGQTISLHFIKETEIIQLMMGNNASYKIPLHSSIEFGVIYNPHNDLSKALNGYIFQTIGDLIEAKPSPVMVYASKSSKTKDKTAEQIVKSGDLLVPLSIKTKGTKPMYLKCWCVKSNAVKRLPVDCKGVFSTTPTLLRVHLTDLVKHAKLPQDVLVLLTSEQKNQLPVDFGTCVSLISQETVLSVIGTTEPSSSAAYQEKKCSLVEIGSGLDVEFEKVVPTEEELELLDKQTKELFRSFSPVSVDSFVDDLPPGCHETQTILNTYFTSKGQGFHLYMPEGTFSEKTEGDSLTPNTPKSSFNRSPLPTPNHMSSALQANPPPPPPPLPSTPENPPPPLPPPNPTTPLPQVNPPPPPPPPLPSSFTPVNPPLPHFPKISTNPPPITPPPFQVTPNNPVHARVSPNTHSPVTTQKQLPEPRKLPLPARVPRPTATLNKFIPNKPPVCSTEDEVDDDYELPLLQDDNLSLHFQEDRPPPLPPDRVSLSSRGSATGMDYEYVDGNNFVKYREQTNEIIRSLREEMSRVASTCTKLRAELDNVKRRLQGM